jgi:mannose-1-phosphate guanylyltransferase
MKAILLAAGYGTRLRPLTDTIPKCLVPIKGQPLLDIWLARLTEAGVKSFLINTHYLKEQVEAYVAASRYRDAITLIHEPQLLGTAGTVRHNRFFWQNDSCVMLVHADNYCLCNFHDFIKAHQQRPVGCVITMMTFQTSNPAACGIIEQDSHNIVRAFHEKKQNPPGNLANAAIYICETSFLSQLKDENDFSCDVLPALMGRIATWENKEVMADIGTLETYAQWK